MQKLLRKIVTHEMDGTNPLSKKETTAMHFSEVEDKDFPGFPPTDEPPEERVRSLMNRMTREEKLKLLGGHSNLAVQAVPRLGLPTLWSSDATTGVRCFPGGTAFPSPVAMAASWNRETLEEVGRTIAEECRARGISILLGPGVNIYRVPTCGRNFEYFGEDPFLAGQAAASYIRGAQERGVITTVKHFACNNSEYDRHKTDSVVDERTLREIYLPPFETAVKEANTWGLMSAYNPVNGEWAGQNRWLLTTILREEWGYEGFVISDWTSLYDTVAPLKAGQNLEMPKAKWLAPKRIDREIARGNLTEEDIDKAIRGLLLPLFAAGVYDRPQVEQGAVPGGEAHRRIALKAAREGAVLLKNDENLLPLDPETTRRLVVLGRGAVNTETGGGGSSRILTKTSVDLLQGIRQAFPDSEVTLIPFRKERISRQEEELIGGADAVVVCAGFDHSEESECWDRPWRLPHSQDRLIRRCTALNPRTVVILTAGGGVETEGWIDQVPALLHTFYLGETVGDAAGEILSGKVNPSGKLPFTMARRWEDFAATAHYVKNPAKTSAGQITIGQGNPRRRRVRKMVYGEKLMVGYRHFDTAGIAPRFPFGHGLSYTRFALSDLTLNKIHLTTGEPLSLSVALTNTGPREGAEVIQIYVGDDESRLARPEKELKEFAKVSLMPGESRTVSFTLPPRAFSFWDPEAKDWVLEPGTFTILAGTSSGTTETPPLRGTLEITAKNKETAKGEKA